MKIEAVTLFNTNDIRFLDAFITQTKKCVDKIHIVVYTHTWTGKPENMNIIQEAVMKYTSSKVLFHIVPWFDGKVPFFWEATGRKLATELIDNSIDYIIYIDVDEILDDELFLKSKDEISKFDCVRFRNYWYFRDATNRANQTENTTVICRTALAKAVPFKETGRTLYFDDIPSGNKSHDFASDGNSIIHHYSWVRTKEEMLEKVKSWGHSKERNWTELVENEFTHPFNGTDFIHGYQYTTVENKYNI